MVLPCVLVKIKVDANSFTVKSVKCTCSSSQRCFIGHWRIELPFL